MKTIISTAVETDGLIPVVNSIIQLGAVAFDMAGKELSSFTANLLSLPRAKPDPETMKWWAAQPKETRMNVGRNREDPKVVINRFADWFSGFDKPVMLFAPVMFDGTFVRYYLCRFAGKSHSWHRAFDLRSVMFALTGKYHGDTLTQIKELCGSNIHANPMPHCAVEDARDQGLHFFALLRWAKKRKSVVRTEATPRRTATPDQLNDPNYIPF